MKRVLLLDDDSDLCLLMSKFFEVIGVLECVTLSSLEELRQAADRVRNMDVIFLDMNLGETGHSGIDAYSFLKEIGYSGKIVILTGYSKSHPMVRKASQLSGVLVLEKPINMKQIEDAIA